MPITIKSSLMQYRDSNGDYVGVDAVSERTTAEYLSAIEDKGETTLESIPEDYTALNNEVEASYRALNNNVIDALGFGNPPSPYTSEGITATRIKEDTWHLVGTITGSSFVRCYSDVNVFPAWLEKGRTYYLTVSGASSNCKIYFEVLGFRNGSTQVSLSGMRYTDGLYKFTIPSDFVGGAIIRIGWLARDSGTAVDETITYHIYTAPLSGNEAAIKAYNSLEIYADSYDDMPTSCDDINENIVYFVSSSEGVPHIADFPLADAGWIQTIVRGAIKLQIAYPYNPHTKYTMLRRGNGSSYTDWVKIGENIDLASILQNIGNLQYSSCDDAEANKIGFVSSNAGILNVPDFPINGPGWLITIGSSNAAVNLQIAFPFQDDKEIKYRANQFGAWNVWKTLGGGQTVTITQEVSRDTYNNTYNIDTTPTITTDTNGWLQPVDTNTQDETGKTDMTGAIMSMLNDTGYCHLAPGIYYVSGNIDMPADSVIEGCGKKTIIRLLQSVESGYIVRMHTRSTLKNVCLSGGYAAGDISNGNIGGRKGINYIGNRDDTMPDVTPKTCTCCIIDGCFFENLDSGFYGYNAGGGLQEGVAMSNCYFTRCKAGINIDYWTEYCKFTNCIIFQCYYACINNGGNNVFTACTFHGVVGFLIDNSSGEKSNSAHGTVNGCTFNHIDNMNNPEQLGKGIAIKVLNITAGFIFANCQLWYGRIHIESSKGVQITGCEIGGLGSSEYPVIETSGNNMVFIDNCLFQTQPNYSVSSPLKVTNCWAYDGAAVTF